MEEAYLVPVPHSLFLSLQFTSPFYPVSDQNLFNLKSRDEFGLTLPARDVDYV